MIDLHAHVLPGIDDGPRDMEGAIALIRQAFEDGIKTIVATPHVGNGIYNPTPEQVLDKLAQVREELDRRRIPVQVLPGMEAFVHVNLARDLEAGRILTINGGPYVCIELPSTQVPIYVQETLFDLKLAGYIPMIIHPERNAAIQRDPNLMEQFADVGAMGILTAGSLTGHFGRTAKRTAEVLIRAGTVQVLATDAHDVRRRPAILSQGLRLLEQGGAQNFFSQQKRLSMLNTEHIYAAK